MTNIIFVCTGNVFRSLTAEFALRRYLGADSNILISSAGTTDFPNLFVRDDVSKYLFSKGLDVTSHQRRTLTDSMVNQADVVVAMSVDHKSYLYKKYAIDFPLFTEASGQAPEALLDVDDLFSPEDRHGPEAQKHIYYIIDTIIDLVPCLANNLKLT